MDHRKIMGRFNYYTVLGVPSACGAALSSTVLAERVVYHYAHGLSTIVSYIIINHVKDTQINLFIFLLRHFMCHFCEGIFTFWEFCEILVWHWAVHSCCWMQFWCMVYVKIEPIDRIGLPSRRNPNPTITNFTKSVRWWINCPTLCDHKSNAVRTKTIAIHLFGRCIFWFNF